MKSTSIDSLPATLAFGIRTRKALKSVRAVGGWLTMRAEDIVRRAPLRFSLVLTAGLFAIVFVSLAPSFQSNDDPQMAMIAAGKGLLAARRALSLHERHHWAHPQSALHCLPITSMVRNILVSCSVSCACGNSLLHHCAAIHAIALRLYLLFFGSVGLFLLNNLQFTTTASLAGQGGMLLCLLTVQTSMPRRRLWPVLGSGVALLVLASLIRLECFYLTLLIALPTAVCLFRSLPRRAVLFSGALVAGGCLALVLGFAAYNDAYYEHVPEWRHFLSYNKLRIIFNDYEWTSYTPQTAHIFEEVNWTENDYSMIASWYYDDPVLYSEERLRHVLDSYPWRSQRLTVSYWWSFGATFLCDRSVWSIVLMFPLFFWCAARSRRNVVAFLVSVAAGAILLASIAVLNKVPPSRVYFPVVTFPLALLLLMAHDSMTLPRLRRRALTLRCLASPGCWRRRTAPCFVGRC